MLAANFELHKNSKTYINKEHTAH